MKRNKILVFFWLLCSFLSSSFAEQEKERLEILNYGLEGDIKVFLVALKTEKNSEYNKEIEQLFSRTTNINILQAIIQYALETRWDDFKKIVFSNSEKLDKMSLSAKLSIISLIGELKWLEAEETLNLWSDGKDKTLALASLRTLGRLGSPSAGNKLMEKLKDPELDPNFRGDLFWALGELKYQPGFDELKSALDDIGTSALLKRIILEALGKMKHPEGGKAILPFLNDTNVLLRAEAVKSMASYPLEADLNQFYKEGLRDSEASVRIAAAEALISNKIPDFVDILEYRIRKDPDLKVRSAAMKALLNQDELEGKKFLIGIIQEGKVDIPTWKLALGMAMEWPETVSSLEVLVEKEIKNQTSGFVGEIANIYGFRKQVGLEKLYTLLLGSKNAGIKSVVLRGIQLNSMVNMRELVRKTTEDPVLANQAKKVLETLVVTPEIPLSENINSPEVK
ncbi:MAG: hypothetical protein A2Z96_00485 [Spirochaetes bacterium GWB1_48_6]|nr:MAG: hypothetical protein A2Z96_00485 [Spirochaetes bacterium GWB1_48_6]